MSVHADQDFGVHQGARRILEINNTGIVNVTIAPGTIVDSQPLYGVGFTHFMGQFSTNTPAGLLTTIEVLIIPRIIGSLGGGGTFTHSFSVALVATLAGTSHYAFYWGEARGLLTQATTGETFCFSPVFFVRLRNAGANPANVTSLEAIVCI